MSYVANHRPTAIFNKIINVNKTMVSSGRKDAALNPGEINILDDLRAALESSKAIPPRSIELVVRIVSSWDYADRLAGLDLLRCIARQHTVAQFSDTQFPSLIHLTVSSSLPSDARDVKPNENAVMMGIRVIANIFATADGRSLASSQAETALSFLSRVVGVQPGPEPIGKFNRNILIAASTAALNYAVLVSRERLLTPQLRQRLFSIIGAILADQTDSEILYRGLVALGTLLCASREAAASLDVKGWIRGAAERGSDDRILEVANETSRILG
jgi:phospholipase A-2-activating protein